MAICYGLGVCVPQTPMGKPNPQEVGLWGCSVMRVEPCDGISAQKAVLPPGGASLGPSQAGAWP